MYKRRFENLSRVANKVTSSLNIGDILVGPETAGRIGGEITLYDRGLMRFKNVKEEVRVFSLIRPERYRSKRER